MDPEIAKNLRHNTLRARFGLDKVKNAVHCTDLPEDGTLESEYFFSIMQREWYIIRKDKLYCDKFIYT